jgi:hypothetical protein
MLHAGYPALHGSLVATFAFDIFHSYAVIFSVFIATNIIAASLVLLASPPRHARKSGDLPTEEHSEV